MKQFPHILRAVSVLFVLFGIAAVNCLECYQCSTINDQKCGVTWGFQGTEGDQYKVDCPTNGSVDATACWKYVIWDSPNDIPTVYRSCWYPHWNESIQIQPWYPHWNATVTTGSYTPSGCSEVMGWTHTRSCHCTDYTQPCNNVNVIAPSCWSLLTALFLGGLTLFKMD